MSVAESVSARDVSRSPTRAQRSHHGRKARRGGSAGGAGAQASEASAEPRPRSLRDGPLALRAMAGTEWRTPQGLAKRARVGRWDITQEEKMPLIGAGESLSPCSRAFTPLPHLCSSRRPTREPRGGWRLYSGRKAKRMGRRRSAGPGEGGMGMSDQNGMSSPRASGAPFTAAPAIAICGAAAVSGCAPFPVHLVEELYAPARDEKYLGREPLGVLILLLPAPGLELARHVDEPALACVFFEHVHEPGLEGHDPVPLGLLHPLAALLVDVALVGGDREVGDASAAAQVVDGDVCAETSDQFRAIESECHGDSPC